MRSIKTAMLLIAACLTTAATVSAQEPKPLPARETIKVAVPGQLKQNAVVILGKELGEFEKENISIEIFLLAGALEDMAAFEREIELQGSGPQEA